MQSNVVNSSAHLRQLYWLSIVMNFFICPLVGIVVIICSQWAIAGVLIYTLLSFMWMALAEYKRYQIMARALDVYLKRGTN